MDQIYYLFISSVSLYIILWILYFTGFGTGKKYIGYLKFFSMLIVLTPFWFIFLILTIDINFPIVSAETEQTVVINNNDSSSKTCIILEKSRKDKEWRPSYRLESVKYTPFITISANSSDTCRYEVTFADQIFACAAIDEAKNFKDFRGLKFDTNINPVNVYINDLANSSIQIQNVNNSREINRILFFMIAILGIWYHAVSFKEKDIKIKGYLAATVLSILCIYLSYKFYATILFFSS